MQRDPDSIRAQPLVSQTSSYRAMLDTIRKKGYQHRDGDHLSSDGPYMGSVEAMCVRNPCLRWGHIEYTATPAEYGKATVLEVSGPRPFHAERQDFGSSQALRPFLKSNNARTSRRVILLEGVARNYVEVLGSHFNMDPSFFANQKRPNSWHLDQLGIERTTNLPSLSHPGRSFMMRYPEMRYFPLKKDGITQLDDKYVKDLDGIRRVDIFKRTREMNKLRDLKSGAFNNVGVVGRAASYWSRRYNDGGWDAIILTDPPVGRIVRTTRLGEIIDGVELKHELYRGGYQDFIPYPEGLEESMKFVGSAAAGPSRASMLEDLCFYFTQNTEQLDGLDDDPDIATVFLKKITASNWIYLADYFRACAHNLEHHFSRNESFNVFTIPTIERWWGDLHSWHRRCVQHCEEVDAILTALRIPPDYVSRDRYESHPMDCREDFAWIKTQLLWTKSQFEHLLSSVTGLNAIAGNKEAMTQNKRYSLRAREESERSLQEARKASILTFLATVFVPLAVTAGIFSMSPEWAPGGDKFVYYWAITLPLVVLLGTLYYLLGQVSKKHRGGEEDNLIGQDSDVEKGFIKRD